MFNAIIQKSLKCSTWVQSQKWPNDISSFPRQTIQHYSNTSLCPNHWWQRSWSLLVQWRPTTPSRTNIKKRCPFHHRGLECKSRKSRDTWNNRQVWPWSTKLSRTKANSSVKRTHWSWPTPFSNNPRDDFKHRHDRMINIEIILIIFFAVKDGEVYSQNKNQTWSWLLLRSWVPYCKIQA